MIVDGKRCLAYTATITDIKPIEGADNIELATVNGGWNVIIKKEEFKINDICVYFEIDSKVPEREWSEFLRKKKFAVKTYKLNKFGVVSQGLVLPINLITEVEIPNEPDKDVTDLIGVTYYVVEDNARKNGDPDAKYKSMAARHKKLFKKPWAKWLMRRAWGRKLMFFFFGKKKDNPRGFPTFVSKTDEERIENQAWRLADSEKVWLMTEKLDGTSCTYALERKGRNKFEFYVCSRNVRQRDENQQTYHDHNIYWDLAFKYNIEQHLKNFLNEFPNLKWVCIQGEGVGFVQGNPLKLKEDDLYVFNFVESLNGRWPSKDGKMQIEEWGMKWVPILGETTLPSTMEEMKKLATGQSELNSEVLREGIVYRSLDGSESFKNVSIEFLLNKKD